MIKSHNMTMLVDFYELTMASGYFESGKKDTIAYFDVFYRRNPDGGGFAIAAGLQTVIDYVKNLNFSEEDIEYLRKKGSFSEEFLDYLKNFKCTCDIWAIPEGTPVFPGEPLITIRGPLIEAQLMETYILLAVNHQSLIATKTNRIVRAAEGRPVMEFGSRRAHGESAAIVGARAAYIAGAAGTACVKADIDYGVPATGTMAHSWVQVFGDELTAFREYAKQHTDNCSLLVDTYDVLKSGVPNAIKVFKEFNPEKMSIRIDSGDITYLSRSARKMLDEAGLFECKIIASNSLDEYLIRDMLIQDAAIDSFGVGEKMITAKSEPVFGGVYKLVAVEEDGEIKPRIKISENIEKITNPGFKKAVRFYDKNTNKAIADLIMLADETIDENKPYKLFNPEFVWKKKIINDFYVKELAKPIFKQGKLVYNERNTEEIREYCKEQLDTLWPEVKRFENPHQYYVDLSEKLWKLKNDLLEGHNFK
ncbi:MAG: nicotinate phosphoribosyltransferase [Firmicutes bacterium]|nr:nicotinate phosphoribosyltransferase [Bacillota bacterium]